MLHQERAAAVGLRRLEGAVGVCRDVGQSPANKAHLGTEVPPVRYKKPGNHLICFCLFLLKNRIGIGRCFLGPESIG